MEDNMIKFNIYLIGSSKVKSKENEKVYWLKIISENDRQHESLDLVITMNHKQELKDNSHLQLSYESAE